MTKNERMIWAAVFAQNLGQIKTTTEACMEAGLAVFNLRDDHDEMERELSPRCFELYLEMTKDEPF